MLFIVWLFGHRFSTSAKTPGNSIPEGLRIIPGDQKTHPSPAQPPDGQNTPPSRIRPSTPCQQPSPPSSPSPPQQPPQSELPHQPSHGPNAPTSALGLHVPPYTCSAHPGSTGTTPTGPPTPPDHSPQTHTDSPTTRTNHRSQRIHRHETPHTRVIHPVPHELQTTDHQPTGSTQTHTTSSSHRPENPTDTVSRIDIPALQLIIFPPLHRVKEVCEQLLPSTRCRNINLSPSMMGPSEIQNFPPYSRNLIS